MRRLIILLVTCFLLSRWCDAQSSIVLKTASHHPMQYYLSLPENWNAKDSFPILVVAEAAEKEFKVNAERFVKARKNLSFIIVAPIITTNGNYGIRDPKVYPYPKEVWDRIDKESNCQFDLNGLQNIIHDVQQQYHGTHQFFISGFEAGTHLVWATAFLHPEWLYAAATVGGNFRNRCVTSNDISINPARINLPLLNFVGSRDSLFGKNGKVYNQYIEAKQLAELHGYTNLSETVLNIEHIPVTTEVLNAFATIWEGRSKK